MLNLVEIVHQLADRNEVVIRGEHFKLKNIVSATDGEVLKARLVLESLSNEDQIALDVGISAKIYKR